MTENYIFANAAILFCRYFIFFALMLITPAILILKISTRKYCLKCRQLTNKGKCRICGEETGQLGSKNRKIVISISIVVLVLTCILTSFLILQSPRITVTNNSKSTLYDIVISGNKFKKQISQLPAGSSFSLTVVPRGESGLAIKFVSPDGIIATDEELAYLEAGNSVHAVLLIDNNYKVKVLLDF